MRTGPLLLSLVVLLGVVAIPVGPTAAQSDNCSFPVSSTDSTGTEVTLEEPPESVIALGPSAAQTLWEIGAEDLVTGLWVSPYTAYLEGAQNRTNVMNPDGSVRIETVVNESPDLVLAANGIVGPDTIESLRDAGLTVYQPSAAATIEDIYTKTEMVGRLTGHCEGAAETVSWMQDRVATVEAAVEGADRPSVLYPLGGGYVPGKGTFLDELIRTAGGENIAATVNISGYKPISPEVIVEENPHWLILNEGVPMSAIQLDAYNETTAIEEDQVIRVNGNYANQPAPRVVIPLSTITQHLHPEAYAAANATATVTDASTRTASPGQPGLGSTVAVLAVLALGLAAGRRR